MDLASPGEMGGKELADQAENKVAFARQAFNDGVMNYNVTREMFPNTIIAGMFNFKEAGLLKLEDEAKRAVPQVKFT